MRAINAMAVLTFITYVVGGIGLEALDSGPNAFVYACLGVAAASAVCTWTLWCWWWRRGQAVSAGDRDADDEVVP